MLVLVATSSPAWGVTQTGACCLSDFCRPSEIEVDCQFTDSLWLAGETCEACPIRGACCETLQNSASEGELAQANGIHICRYTWESDCTGQWNPTITCDVEGCCDPTPGACVADGKCENLPRIDCLGEWNEVRCLEPVPTITEWGIVLLMIMLIGSATMVIRRRKQKN